MITGILVYIVLSFKLSHLCPLLDIHLTHICLGSGPHSHSEVSCCKAAVVLL